MRRIRAAAVTMAMAAVPVVGLQTGAVALTATKTQIFSSSVQNGKEIVDANLSKSSTLYGIGGKTLVFKYYKKVDGNWALRSTKQVETSGMGLASATFTAPAKGTCKVLVKFNGTSKLAASKDAWVISCATGEKN